MANSERTTGREIHYRGSEGVCGYQAGDILIDDETGQRLLAVKTGHGVQLEPAPPAEPAAE